MPFNPAEQVLCVTDKLVRKLEIKEPFDPNPSKEAIGILISTATFQMRGVVEEDEKFRQLIPYVVTIFEGKVLLLERLSSQGESRLHNRLSVGVGGHINPGDSVNGGQDIILNGMWRELREELRFNTRPETKFKGIINYYGEQVAKFHLGIVYTAIFTEEPAIRETEKMSGEFLKPAELTNHYDRMEGWSIVTLEHLGF